MGLGRAHIMNIPKTVPSLAQSILAYNNINELVAQLAKYCIDHNLYRKGNDFYDFNHEEIRAMNRACKAKDAPVLDGGYFFLWKPNESEGLIRLYAGDCNPKWGFWIDNGEIKVDWA